MNAGHDWPAPRKRFATRSTVWRASALGCLALVLVAASCGTAETPAKPSTTTNETVTITHRYGTTKVPVKPKRIVSLDTQWTDTLAALGHPPTAYLRDPNLPDDLPWRDATLRKAGTLHATTALPYEQIAAANPDLIVVSYLADSKTAYDKLSKIAPTIATLGSGSVDTWQAITKAAGKVLDDPTAANELIASVDAKIDAVKTELPGLAGKTMAMANYVAGDGIYVVADPKDGSMSLFEALGMSITPTILHAGNVDQGRVKLSFEKIALLDADLLVILLHGADPAKIAGYAELPAVKSGAVADLDYAAVTGLNTPSPLSIPYVLDELKPALTKAADS